MDCISYWSSCWTACNCCGYEFGNDDEAGTGQAQSFESYLDEWISDGSVWFTPEEKPDNWSLSNQLSGKKIFRLPNSRVIDASAIGPAYTNAIVVWESNGVKASAPTATADRSLRICAKEPGIAIIEFRTPFIAQNPIKVEYKAA